MLTLTDKAQIDKKTSLSEWASEREREREVMRCTLTPHAHWSWQTAGVTFSTLHLNIKTQVLALFSIM